MGGPSYSFQSRSARTEDYKSKSMNDIFEQNIKRTAHTSMIPALKENKAHLRESRDSEAHPNSVPIIITLDITGSKGSIPENLIKTGLPTMVAKLKELGVESPHILIIAVGDSRRDNNNGVFQLGQFEGGDKEMDMWLERIWISEGGGGNGSESYNWAYYYALNHVQTDAWDKRKQKGFIFTIGDDHCQPNLTKAELDEVMGYLSKGESVDTEKIVEDLREKWKMFHIELGSCKDLWCRLIGSQNVVEMKRNDYEGIAKQIATLVAENVIPSSSTIVTPVKEEEDKPFKITL